MAKAFVSVNRERYERLMEAVDAQLDAHATNGTWGSDGEIYDEVAELCGAYRALGGVVSQDLVNEIEAINTEEEDEERSVFDDDNWMIDPEMEAKG